MAKNDSVIWYRGQNIRAGHCGKMLEKSWTEFANAITQKAILYGGAEAKMCAELLLDAAKNLCPVGHDVGEDKAIPESRANYHGGVWRGSGSQSFHSRLSDFSMKYSVSKSKDHTFQGRDSKGHFAAKQAAFKEARHGGLLSFTHNAGSLRESGRVKPYLQVDGDKKKGFEVSFDTRRTDPRSLTNNFNYAVIQHEDMNMKHTVGQAKFLFVPYQLHKKTFMSWIGEAVKKGVKEGAKKTK